MFPPPELWPLMEQQGNLLFRAQLLAAGVTPSTVDKRLGRGQLVAVQPGVYRLPGAALEPRQLIHAATERANGYATGWSALGLYGVLDLDARLAPWVAVPRDRQVRGAGFIVQRERLDDRDRRRVGGIPCVGPFLALCDYARRVQGLRLLDAIDESRRAGLISLERLRDRAVQLGKHRGAVEIRRLFRQGLLDQDGEGERRLARALASVELYPAWGVEIVRGVIVDACLPASSLIPEFDGVKWHLPGRRGLDGAAEARWKPMAGRSSR
ncbi:MAG: type IV toxin-antitoxin system AbiEi family antitoxin domain-containing protein [Egibacteraceae bacterium]